ncbi:hypothetical protein Tco_1391068 [Tanacetum coccineum]
MVAPPTTTAPPSLLLEVVIVSTPISGVPVVRAPMYGADGWENVEAPVRALLTLLPNGWEMILKGFLPSLSLAFSVVLNPSNGN